MKHLIFKGIKFHGLPGTTAVQYFNLSFCASFDSPMIQLSNASANASQVGGGSTLVSHLVSISRMLVVASKFLYWMLISVPGSSLSMTPMLYHAWLTPNSSVQTFPKSDLHRPAKKVIFF